MKMKKYAVIGRYAESGQIVCDEAIAATGRSAIRKAHEERKASGEGDGWEPIAAIKGDELQITYGDER